LRRLHIVQGGVENGDKRRLERTAGSRRTLRSWVVPKAVQPGDDVVIHIGGHGLFATAVVKSSASPRKGWKNRYGADVGDIRLIAPPIPMAVVQQRVPELNWANYPRSVTTPVADVAAKLRALIRRKNGKVDAEPSGGDSFDRESAQRPRSESVS
jgi:hypothetical protein